MPDQGVAGDRDVEPSTAGAAPDPHAAEALARAGRLLAAARSALDGAGTLPQRRRTRAAAVIARAALELAVDARLARHGLELGRASMRSRLICLATLVDGTAGDAAALAWAGLSSGCHQHAYELTPTWAETSHLLGLVGTVLGMDPPDHRQARRGTSGSTSSPGR